MSVLVRPSYLTSRSQRTWCPNTRLATCTCRLHCESKGKATCIASRETPERRRHMPTRLVRQSCYCPRDRACFYDPLTFWAGLSMCRAQTRLD
ncbi:hypothetical protein G6O67_001971 [Ophiocordyceps sinensis]|uniref:Uncharacterized protein n=1 Tax=Ophiocordyceps sinensis TaxID=72228 RepID=A0A8H4PTF2_9HYPO|nr:hypothetical protein G6O67_001971 [Ophiocordyceps sinensis]